MTNKGLTSIERLAVERHLSGVNLQYPEYDPDDVDAALDEIERLRAALEIIAGQRQCVDNLMSNVEIARAALNIHKGAEK